TSTPRSYGYLVDYPTLVLPANPDFSLPFNQTSLQGVSQFAYTASPRVSLAVGIDRQTASTSRSYTPGQTVQFTVQVSNATGPSNAYYAVLSNAQFKTAAGGGNLQSVTWRDAAGNVLGADGKLLAVPPANGVTDIQEIPVTIP